MPSAPRSHEGKLQVELARLQYLSTRLVRRWSHLERQSGGIGMRGGPGETQIELDRRMINDADQAHQGAAGEGQAPAWHPAAPARAARRVHGLAGRLHQRGQVLHCSTRWSRPRAYAADQLFATLDTTTRQLYLGEVERTVSLSDTVGFIRDLPHGLVEAFAATLQEARDADLLLHVVDAANPDHPEQIQEVSGCCAKSGPTMCRKLWCSTSWMRWPLSANRCSVTDIMELDGVAVPRVFLSARTGLDLDALRSLLAQRLQPLPAQAVPSLEPPNSTPDRF